MPDWMDRTNTFDWSQGQRFLQHAHFRPIHDRAFNRLLTRLHNEDFSLDSTALRVEFLRQFDKWVHSSRLNCIRGLEAFPDRDVILGVTHALDDLHITFGSRLVVMEKEYAYHRRMKADLVQRRPETLQSGDVLVLAAPFAWYGDLHPQTELILSRCLELAIPVHVDAAWYGCLRGFEFDYSHPAIQSVSFSLSKGLGLGAHRAGVRYARQRHAGPVSIMNDFNMHVSSVLWIGGKFMNEFGADYVQNRYGEAYLHVCEKLRLRPTKAIHTAFHQSASGDWLPVGIRPFLRYLVDDMDEFKSTQNE